MLAAVCSVCLCLFYIWFLAVVLRVTTLSLTPPLCVLAVVCCVCSRMFYVWFLVVVFVVEVGWFGDT